MHVMHRTIETVHVYNVSEWIFTALALVKATTGVIGGDLSHEFHVTADIGEDRVVTCPE